MQLQSNTQGAWRNLITFAAADLPQVQAAAERLGRAAFVVAYAIDWRVLADDGSVLMHWAPNTGWRPARRVLKGSHPAPAAADSLRTPYHHTPAGDLS